MVVMMSALGGLDRASGLCVMRTWWRLEDARHSVVGRAAESLHLGA